MVTRRLFIGVLLAAAVVTPAIAAEHPSVTYMRQVGKDLLNAHRQGTVTAFLRAVQRHGDISGIGDYSLGEYETKLSSGQRPRYYKGVATFISRYFSEQSREFRVAKYEIGEATVSGNKEIVVETKVFLLSGQTYSVNWRLAWKGGRYRVIDAKMLGFSLTYLQRNLFTSFLSKRNGDVAQLVAALNR
jgi:phospholipid transport system substrate-binding protein